MDKPKGEEQFAERPISLLNDTPWGDLTNPYNTDGEKAIETGLIRVERNEQKEITSAFITVKGQAWQRDKAAPLSPAAREAIKKSKIKTIKHVAPGAKIKKTK